MIVFATAAVRQVSIALAILAAMSLGVALADIIYTKITVCDGDSAPACSPVSIAIILTYVGAGVWASVFVRFRGCSVSGRFRHCSQSHKLRPSMQPLCVTVGCPSVCLSVRLSHLSTGLLLWVRRAGDVERQRRMPMQHGAQQHGGQQQLRAVSRCQLT